MSKSLKTIQVLAKIAYVISSIVFVFSIIGGVSCVLALVLLGSVKELGTEFVDISRSIFNETGMSMLSVFYACLIGALGCVAGALLSFMSKRYFKTQLDAGTPFTYVCAQKMLKLGLWFVITPIAVSVCSAVMYIVLFAFDPSIFETELSATVDISTGIIFLILSVVFKHGAEIAERLNNTANDVNQNVPVDTMPQFADGGQSVGGDDGISGFGSNNFDNK